MPGDWNALSVEETLHRLERSPLGLNPADATRRLARYGPNELQQLAKIPPGTRPDTRRDPRCSRRRAKASCSRGTRSWSEPADGYPRRKPREDGGEPASPVPGTPRGPEGAPRPRPRDDDAGRTVARGYHVHTRPVSPAHEAPHCESLQRASPCWRRLGEEGEASVSFATPVKRTATLKDDSEGRMQRDGSFPPRKISKSHPKPESIVALRVCDGARPPRAIYAPRPDGQRRSRQSRNAPGKSFNIQRT